ncbi:conserved hypothetical protein [Rhodococcus jostii RHA1]|uniref:Uncharacterized protein n=1 Tax=Rhodococcus jostii (strain RHA1) TaxID=101510 RepID=Q0SBS8_RHOJR|nr:hypothetical protein [Rhodococcus jostii]ABG95008.1 conserved hypothetical protein [Rhodococcus jostii RHA1]
MTDENDRRAITAAMQRLFAGTPLRSSGKLDIVTLAQEAGVKRNKLTHKHTDLKDLFYAQRRTRDGVPDNEAKLREQIVTLEKANQSLREDRDRYRLTSEMFARALHVLTIENDNFRRDARNRPPPPPSHYDHPRLAEHLKPGTSTSR